MCLIYEWETLPHPLQVADQATIHILTGTRVLNVRMVSVVIGDRKLRAGLKVFAPLFNEVLEKPGIHGSTSFLDSSII
jgi:hypothetical protein